MKTPQESYDFLKAMSPLHCWAGTLEPLGLTPEQAEKVGLLVQCYSQQMYSYGVLCAKKGIAECDAETAEKIANANRQVVEICGREIGIGKKEDVQ